MEIVWHGLSCFRLTERGRASVVTDPYRDAHGYSLPRPRADIISVSCNEPLRRELKSVRGPSTVLEGPGEYEIGGVFVTGVAMYNTRRRTQPTNRNIAFVFEFDGTSVCHLGAIDFLPTQSQLEALGPVNILLTPVGGKGLVRPSQVSELISLLEPSIVVPMHYQAPPGNLGRPTVSPFLKEMGTPNPATQETLKVTASSLPNKTQIVLLTVQQ